MRKLIAILTIATLSTLLPACKKSEDGAPDKAAEAPAETATKPVEATEAPAAEPAQPAAAMPPAEVGSWQEIPNISGFIADVPTGAEPNATGGAAGFHAADDSYGMMLREESPEEAAKDMDTIKKETEQVLFKKWIQSDATADGWALAWESAKMDSEGNEAGSQFSYQVRRKLGDKTYSCYGAVAKADAVPAALKSCASIRAR